MKDDAHVAEQGAAGESESAQTLRVLENRLDKANIKCVEANHINNTYKLILTKLQDVSSPFSLPKSHAFHFSSLNSRCI